MTNKYAICVFYDHHYFDCILKTGLSEEDADDILREYDTLLELHSKVSRFVYNATSTSHTYLMQRSEYENLEDVKYFYNCSCKHLQDKLNLSADKLRDLFCDHYLETVKVGE